MLLSLIKSKIKSSFGKDVVLTFITQIVIMLCLLFINKILSNTLEINEFGQYNIIKKSSSVICFVMLSGMGIALPRYLSLYKSTDNMKDLKSSIAASFIIILGISIITFLLCLAFKSSVQDLIIGEGTYFTYIAALFYSFGLCFSSYLYAYFRGIGKYKQFSISQTVIQLLLLLVVCFMNTNITYIYVLWSIIMVMSSIIFFAIELYTNNLYKLHLITISSLKQNIKTLIIYGFPRLIGDFFLFAISAFPLIYLNQQMNAEAVAFFSIGITLCSIVTPLFSFLGMVLLPYIASFIAKKKYNEAKSLVNKLSIIYIITAIFAIIILWIGMDFFIPFFFSDKYIAAKNISQIQILSILPVSMYLLYRNPIDAISVIPYNTIALLVSFVLMVFLFYHSSSLESFAYSYLVALSFNGILSLGSWILLKRNKLRDESI